MQVPPEVVRAINRVSPSFCLAKWLQVTVDIVHGTNHSCHHPARHSIPLSELQSNLHAFHNTRFKKEQRKLMLEGKRPRECVYCWDMEDAGSPCSDRITKSSDPWALPHVERISKLPWDADVLPTYLEVMLDNRCNLSCAYCMADISTAIAAEMNQHGPYPVSDKAHRMPEAAPSSDPGAYVEAFWRWIPMVLPSLNVLRITGGEPLLSPRLEQLLDLLERGHNPNLVLMLNSHLSFKSERISRLSDRIDRLLQGRAIRAFEIYTSTDASGAAAEYIRSGLDYVTLLNNVRALAARFPSSQIVLMCTFNLLSLSTFGDLLRDISDLKQEYPNIVLDTAYLRNPEYLSASIATADLKSAFMKSISPLLNGCESVFSEHERLKIENAIRWMNSELPTSELNRRRRDFLLFVSEYDRRKGTSFMKTFPEYLELYRECKQAVLQG